MGVKPAQPGGQDDAKPGATDQPAEPKAAKGSSPGTTHWLNIDKQSDEAIIQFLGLDRTDRAPQSRPAQTEAGKPSDSPTMADFEPPGARDRPAETGGAGDKPRTVYGENLENLSAEELRSAGDPNWGIGSRSGQLEKVDHTDRPRPGHCERLPDESSEAIERFDPRQANLPEVRRQDAPDYVRDNVDRRPWLKPAERSPAEVQHVVAAVDQGGGHHLERHEGYTTGERLERRVARLEDPAQLDPGLRAQGKDSEKPHRLHGCEELATSINEPEAFAAAFARGVHHPDVRAILERSREPHEKQPFDVEVPIVDLLGENGHQYCTGYRLLPIDVADDQGPTAGPAVRRSRLGPASFPRKTGPVS